MCVSTSLFLWQLKAAHGWVWTTVCILTNTDGAGASARRGATNSIGTGRSLYTTPAETGTVVHSGKLTNTTGMLTAVCRETTTFAKWPRFGCFTLYIEIGKFCFFLLYQQRCYHNIYGSIKFWTFLLFAVMFLLIHFPALKNEIVYPFISSIINFFLKIRFWWVF